MLMLAFLASCIFKEKRDLNQSELYVMKKQGLIRDYTFSTSRQSQIVKDVTPMIEQSSSKNLNNFFVDKEIDVGMINSKMDSIIVNFSYSNQTGDIVTILKVRETCGCLSSEYPKYPIKRKEKGVMKVLFNLKGYKGHFHKSIVVYVKGFQPVVLKFKGFIN